MPFSTPKSPRLNNSRRSSSAADTKAAASTTPKHPYSPRTSSPPSSLSSSSSSASRTSAHPFSFSGPSTSSSFTDATSDQSKVISGIDAQMQSPRGTWRAPDEWGVGGVDAQMQSPQAWRAPDEWGVVPESPTHPIAAHTTPIASSGFPGVPDEYAGQLDAPYDYAGLDVEDVLRGGGEEYHRPLYLDDEADDEQSFLSAATAVAFGPGVAAGPWGYEPTDAWGGTHEVGHRLLKRAPPRLPQSGAAASSSSLSSGKSSAHSSSGAGARSTTSAAAAAAAARSSNTANHKLFNRKSAPVPPPTTRFVPHFSHQEPGNTPPTSDDGHVTGNIRRRKSLVARFVHAGSSSSSRANSPPPTSGRRKGSLPNTPHRHSPKPSASTPPVELALNSMLRSPAKETFVSSQPPARQISRSASASATGAFSGGFYRPLTGRPSVPTMSSPGTSSTRRRAQTTAYSSPAVESPHIGLGIGSSGTLQNSSSSAATVTLGQGVAVGGTTVDVEHEVLAQEAATEAERANRMGAVRRWRRGLSVREAGRG